MFIDQRIRFHLLEGQMPPPPARVLEVGCGGGQLLRHLRQKGYDVRGCELSPELVALHAGTEWEHAVFRASGTALPEPDGSYDVVISSDVLEHVPPEYRQRFLQEMVRVTKPGGRVVFTYWSRNNWSFRLYGGYHLLRRGDLPPWYLEHITLTPPAMPQVEQWMRELGTVTCTRRYQGPVNMLLCCIDHLHHVSSPRLHRFIGRRFRSILALDRLGGCSSQLIALEKPPRA